MTKRTPRRSSKAITIQDVARHAGVSTMTVSNVINGRKSVQESMRAGVMTAIEELGYMPNAAARALASAAPTRIGLIYSNPNSPFLSSILVSVLDVTSQLGAELIIRRASREEMGPTVDAIRALIRSGVNGILLRAPFCDIISPSPVLKEFPVSFMALAPGEELANMPGVRIDNFGASRLLTAKLIEQGHRSIGIICGDSLYKTSVHRYEGYKAALEAAGLHVSDRLIAQGDYSYQSGLVAASKLLELSSPPTAIVASGDAMAAATVSIAHQKGLKVGQQLAVVGFGDAPIASHITTVRLPFAEMAVIATQRLIHGVRARDAAADYSTIYVPFELVERESAAIGMNKGPTNANTHNLTQNKVNGL